MSTYAHNPDTRAVVATWPLGVGHVAKTVVELPTSVPESRAFDLVYAATNLADCLRRLYAVPAPVEIDDEQDRWNRQSEEAAAGELETFLRSPNLPLDGMLVESYVEIEELGHRVGRELHDAGDSAVSDAIVADLLEEADAVNRAGRAA